MPSNTHLKTVVVIVAVDVIGPVLVAVHVNLNAPVAVIDAVNDRTDLLDPRRFHENGSDHAHGGVPGHVHGHVHGGDHSHVNGHDHVNGFRDAL